MTSSRKHPTGRRLFSEEQAYRLIKAYDEGETQQALCRVAEEMVGHPVSISTIRNLLSSRTYKNLAVQPA